jgi:hypothetical protein
MSATRTPLPLPLAGEGWGGGKRGGGFTGFGATRRNSPTLPSPASGRGFGGGGASQVLQFQTDPHLCFHELASVKTK